MKPPDEVKLNREEGEALIERLQANRLSAEDRRVVEHVIRFHFWLTYALQETKISLSRLKKLLFGQGRGEQEEAANAEDTPDEQTAGEVDATESPPSAEETAKSGEQSAAPEPETETEAKPGDERPPRRGHGHRGADGYPGAKRVRCQHESLAVGERCPVCGRGKLYALPDGVELRIDGQALLSAVHYEIETLRCSACGESFRAALPAGVGEEQYTPSARAVVALSRYYLGLPFHRLEGFQNLVGVPVADATAWDQAEGVADCAYPVVEQLITEAAQSPLIFHDDTTARIITLIKANRQPCEPNLAPSTPVRRGIYTSGMVAQNGERTIILYWSGRAHAGENLAEVLKRRRPDLPPPIVMSDALPANHLADESGLVRSYCLAHGLRQFSDIEEVFPRECERVLSDLSQVYEFEHDTVEQAMNGAARLTYHQTHSGPILAALKLWLEQQLSERLVEPRSSLGKAFHYLLKHWEGLTRFLAVIDAPLDNNMVERALKLMIRQRRNSLFFASEHSARVASLLTSLIATAIAAGINVLEYLVALQENRSAVFADPVAWLPWHYQQTVHPAQAT